MDFALAPWWIIWLVATIILAIVEIFTMMVLCLCLAVGTLGALVVALFDGSVEMQVITLAVVALLAFVCVNPIMKRVKARRKSAEPVSNMDALIGRRVTIGSDTARVKVDGDNWQIRPESGCSLTAGTEAEIVGYDSIVLILKPL